MPSCKQAVVTYIDCNRALRLHGWGTAVVVTGICKGRRRDIYKILIIHFHLSDFNFISTISLKHTTVPIIVPSFLTWVYEDSNTYFSKLQSAEHFNR